MDCVASEGTACKKRRVGVDGVSGVTSGVSGKEVPSCGSKSESSSDSDECAEELQFIGGVDSNVEDSVSNHVVPLAAGLAFAAHLEHPLKPLFISMV